MSVTALPSPGRADARIAAVVLAIAAGAWALTAGRMAGMDTAPGADLGGLGWFAISWLAMMAAMMLPALAPMAVAYGRHAGHSGGAGQAVHAARHRAAPHPGAPGANVGATALFVAGYLAVWLAAGLVAYAAIEAVHALDVGFLAWNDGGRYVAAGVIAAAGLYQLTAAKQACLDRCRDRSAFLREHWRAGAPGALRMGVEHGGFCVGCTWALMAALFALGVMSLAWMAVVAVLIAAERLLPRPASLAVSLVLVALAVSVALVPGRLPGFTVPGSPSMPAMQMS